MPFDFALCASLTTVVLDIQRAGFAFGVWVEPCVAVAVTRIKSLSVVVAGHSVREFAGRSNKFSLTLALAVVVDSSLAAGTISSVRVLAVLSGMAVVAIVAGAVGLGLPETSACITVAVLTLKTGVRVRR